MKARLFICAALGAIILGRHVPAQAEQPTTTSITLWHSYQADERKALEQVVERFQTLTPQITVRALAIPHDAYPSKLSAAIPRGHGPDLFIFAHERIGSWLGRNVVQPLDPGDLSLDPSEFLPKTVAALTFQGKTYGLPLAFKSTALFYNKKLVPNPPQTTNDLRKLGHEINKRNPDHYGLVYATDEFYFHAPWLYGFGGKIFDAAGKPRLDRKPIAASLDFVRQLIDEKVIPKEANTVLATRLFNEGKAAMALNGPWFVGEIDGSIDYGVAPLPVVSETGKRATPFLTVEAVMLAGRTQHRAAALQFAQFLAGPEGAKIRATVARQSVALLATYKDPRVAQDPILRAFREQLEFTVIMSNRPEMQLIWEPAKGALLSVQYGTESLTALKRAQTRIDVSLKPPPKRAALWPYLVALGFLASLGFGLLLRRRLRRRDGPTYDPAEQRRAYVYLAPAFAGLLFLVLVPFTVALGIAFCHHHADEYTFVGFANFTDILFSESYGLTDPLSFYFTLVVTLLWTVANVVLHASIGLALALLLKEPWLQLKGVYRALLIIPWAVPNYITALIWKGMFHQQFGAINGLLNSLGIESVGWFSGFWTAFTANVITNTWLGFPFMMVVALGALQSIPSHLYEAAEVDGASRWQRFCNITLPLLRPAMLPAVILGMIWTFNMFNIVYLVSGGEPDGATDILISEAYRWAFQRQEQYGYAAAYATLIFCILVGYTLATRRILGKEEFV